MQTLSDIGRIIREARHAAKLSAQALADKAGVHRNTVIALESGRGNTGLAHVLAIASALELQMLLVPREVADLRAADTVTTDTELARQVGSLMGKKS